MKIAKYIILEKGGLETAVILHGSVSHNEAANLDAMRSQGTLVNAAGYFVIGEDGKAFVDPDLRSGTLDLRSRPQDAVIIQRTLVLLGLAPSSTLNFQPSTL